jgi:uncharacterized protein involved in exopolysaccharide biosynthesis
MAYDIAIPDDDSKSLQDYLDALRRRGGTALKIALAILVLGLIAIFLWPNSYRSTATILIEDPEVPPGLVPTTVTTFAARQIQYINQRVMTRTNLAQIIEKFDLFPKERNYLPTLMLVNKVENLINIDLVDVQMMNPANAGQQITSTIAFTLGFEHEKPDTARKVANELVSLYLNENVRARTEQTAQTSQFMQVEVDRLDAEVRDIESQIAKIKQENEGSLPQQVVINQQLLQRADQELLDIDRQVRGLVESRALLDAQLAQIEPMKTMIMPDGRGVAPPEDQLRALQSQLAILEGRYSADHPDVVRVRRDIEALKLEVGDNVRPEDTDARLAELRAQLAMARERYREDHPEVARLQRQIRSVESSRASVAAGQPNRSSEEPNNPAYIQVQAQRKNLDLQEAALRRQREEVRAQIVDFERRIGESSEVERELSGLMRRMDTATASYQAARTRLFAAQMGQSLETQSKGERFTLVEPPDLPLQPSSPNRPVLLALLIVLCLAVGFGWPQVAESMDGSINSARAIERVQGSPPLAEIPLIQNTEDKTHKRNVRLYVLVLAPVIVAIAAVIVHFFVINLDVAWYVALRRLGM